MWHAMQNSRSLNDLRQPVADDVLRLRHDLADHLLARLVGRVEEPHHGAAAPDGVLGVARLQEGSLVVVAAHEVGVGARDAKALTGGVAIKPVSADGAWDTRLAPDKIPTADERKKLLLKYAKRGPFEGKFDPVFWS